MNNNDRMNLIHRISELEGLTDKERSALLGLLRESKTYGLVWEDKPEAVEDRMQEELPVLKEVKERAIISDAPDAPNHILIEGDNLEALTTLAYTHEGKIDVIYIDPPYNTGNKDFVYNDSYVDKEDSYRHSKWLSFMSQRLKIAKQLLSDKGVIFISIDDNEQAQLKLLCDEVFGNNNFLGQIILKTATDNNPSQINTEHEYMLSYCTNKSLQENWKRQSQGARLIMQEYKILKNKGLSISDIQVELRKFIRNNKSQLPQVAHYNNVDERGVYSSSSNSSNPHPGGYMYDIIHPKTNKPCPKPLNGWRWPKSTFWNYNSLGDIEWGKDETTQPHVKKRIETSTEYLRTLIYEDNRGTTKALSDIFGGKKVFDNPKPTIVLSRILDFASHKQSTILDFFAGSGTTLHATMQLNAEDGGTRQCILVTNNENGICENVTYERNKRVICGYTTPKGEQVEGLKNNNLRYYKTDFVPREPNNRNKRALVAAATDLLCVKNDVYKEQTTFGGHRLKPTAARYFDDRKTRMLIIYNELTVDAFVKVIDGMEMTGRIKVYVFSNNRYAYNDNFEPVAEKVEVCALPAAIYDAYKKVIKPRKHNNNVSADVPFAEETSIETKQGTLNFKEEGGEA